MHDDIMCDKNEAKDKHTFLELGGKSTELFTHPGVVPQSIQTLARISRRMSRESIDTSWKRYYIDDTAAFKLRPT